MSLLMKALEKAAKDRGEARTEPPASPAEARPELTLALELLAADTPSPRLRDEPRSDASEKPEPPSGYYRGDATRAAAVVEASQGRGGVGSYLRDRPIVLFGAAAALFALAFGSYVYLQVFHPALFVRPNRVPAMAPAVVEAPAAPSIAASPPIPTATVVQPAATGGLEIPALTSPSQPRPATIPTAEPRPQASPGASPKPTVVRPPDKPEPKPRSSIVVRSGERAPSINPTLADAYAALQAGQLDRADRLYTQLLRTEPKNADVLLGLAAIAAREGRSDDAAGYYRAILEINPRHAIAQSGLIGLMGRVDPLAAESHLKTIISREPSAYAYFTLGNLYADQSLWAQAQQAYFQAHHLEPDNPDYAYNLAVGLEHLSQPRLAAGFYRRALELAANRGHVNFDPARARERIAALTARVE